MATNFTQLTPTEVPDGFLPLSNGDQQFTTERLPHSVSQCCSNAPGASAPKTKRKRRASWFPGSKSASTCSKEDKSSSPNATLRRFSLTLPSFSFKQCGKSPQKDPKSAEKEDEGGDETGPNGTTTNSTRRRSSLAKIKDFFSSLRKDSFFGNDKPELHYYDDRLEPLAQNGLLRFHMPSDVPKQPSSISGGQRAVPYEELTLRPCSSTYWRDASYHSRPCTVVSDTRNSGASVNSSAPTEVREHPTLNKES